MGQKQWNNFNNKKYFIDWLIVGSVEILPGKNKNMNHWPDWVSRKNPSIEPWEVTLIYGHDLWEETKWCFQRFNYINIESPLIYIFMVSKSFVCGGNRLNSI